MPQEPLPICPTSGILGESQGIAIKNALLKLLTKHYRRYRGDVANPKRILIASTTGLGDTLWATPAIRALKKAHPNSKLCLLTSPIGEQVLKNNPYIDHILIMKNASLIQAPKIVYKIRQFAPEQIYIFHTSQRIALPLCAMNRAKSIIGTQGLNKGLDTLLTQSFPLVQQHEISRRMQMTGLSGDETLDWHISSDEAQWAQEFMKQFTAPIIALHPGSKDRFKQWPVEHFIKLGEKCVKQLGAQVVVTGNALEKPLADQIAASIDGALSLAGQLNIRQLGALLPHFKRFITNDTGPMHMAFATKVPTIALFSPTDPNLCGPHHAKSSVAIAKNKTCFPCLRKKCHDPFCMRSIGIDEVFCNISQ